MTATAGQTRLGKRRRHLAGVLFAVALITAGAAAPSVHAHTGTFSSQHVLTFTSGATGDSFSGQVTSALPACGSARPITLYRAGGQIVGTASTDAQGVWSQQTSERQAGDYYAAAARQVVKQPGHKHTCEAARSNTVTVQSDADGDGVGDLSDNCPGVANPSQEDLDRDGYGNACDADADGDGLMPSDGDCADNDASRHPGAPDDTQNGIDEDCDGSVDEDFYRAQADGDSDGYTPAQGDCNDIHPLVNPGAAEIDDGMDNDCDGATDEGLDADGDGFTPNAGGDCDDADPNVHPWRDDPVNGIDDNCDGIVDGSEGGADPPTCDAGPGEICTAGYDPPAGRSWNGL